MEVSITRGRIRVFEEPSVFFLFVLTSEILSTRDPDFEPNAVLWRIHVRVSARSDMKDLILNVSVHGSGLELTVPDNGYAIQAGSRACLLLAFPFDCFAQFRRKPEDFDEAFAGVVVEGVGLVICCQLVLIESGWR